MNNFADFQFQMK